LRPSLTILLTQKTEKRLFKPINGLYKGSSITNAYRRAGQHRHCSHYETLHDIFVGDIHGFLSIFHEGLTALKFDPDKDRVFCVGDLIDRGPDSLECLRLVCQPWLHAVIGNHKLLLIEHLQKGDGRKTLENLWLRIPDDPGHPFHLIPATDSI